MGTWTSPALFDFEMRRADVVAQIGEPHATDLDSNGWGPYDAWALRFPCGLEVALWVFRIAPTGRRLGDNEVARFEVHATDTDEAHVCFHLPFRIRNLSRWTHDPPIEAPRAMWVVWRQDDNGNRFEVGSYSSRCEAVETARRFEARGHKQMYWVEQLTPAR